MAEQNDFNSIDALFREGLKSQPEAPATSGWDTPSSKVWEGIQANMPEIQAPKPNFPIQFQIGLAALTVAGVVLAVLFFQKPESDTKVQPPLPETKEMPKKATVEQAIPASSNAHVEQSVESKASTAPTGKSDAIDPVKNNGKRVAPKPSNKVDQPAQPLHETPVSKNNAVRPTESSTPPNTKTRKEIEKAKKEVPFNHLPQTNKD